MERRRHTLRGAALLPALALLLAAAGCKRDAPPPSGPRLPLAAPIPADFPRATQLTLGDPVVKKQLALMGQLDKLPFSATWPNISGGPNTIEAYRAGALDGGSVGDTPPIHAAFTGLDVKIVMVNDRDRPTYSLGLGPGTTIETLADLKGKRIGYAPGQAQGALVQRVLKKAGLAQSDVKLIELNATEFRDALVGRQIDMAPLAGVSLVRYLKEYGPQGAKALEHGVRDNLAFFYVQTAVLEDAHKAAALQSYVKTRARAQLWAADHPERWTDAYYVKDQGLSPPQAKKLVELLGRPQYPSDWSEAIAMTQETIDMMAAASGRPSFDAHKLFDRRFERLAAQVQEETSARLHLPKAGQP
jgi:sulfonate transport system substrate-binding protein